VSRVAGCDGAGAAAAIVGRCSGTRFAGAAPEVDDGTYAYTESHRSTAWEKPLVIGLGTDLIEIERIAHSVERYGEAFLRRIFTAGEIEYCQRKKKNSAESLAARFAAKEAGAKALGTGISRGVSWLEFEVRRLPGQRPELYLSGRAEEVAKALGIRRLSLSLAHTRGLSIAVVMAED